MDVSTTLAITQSFMVLTLLGLLLAWMVTFAVLALRANPTATIKAEELSTPVNSFPAITVPNSTSPHVRITQPVAVPVGKRSHDNSDEMGVVPIV
jgi:hypothetical protein